VAKTVFASVIHLYIDYANRLRGSADIKKITTCTKCSLPRWAICLANKVLIICQPTNLQMLLHLGNGYFPTDIYCKVFILTTNENSVSGTFYQKYTICLPNSIRNTKHEIQNRTVQNSCTPYDLINWSTASSTKQLHIQQRWTWVGSIHGLGWVR